MFETEFLDAITSHGFNPGSVTADGKYHRFDIKKKGDLAGYYNLDTDGHGVFGNWKTSEQFIFRSDSSQKMTEEERREAAARYKERTRKQREETENRYVAVAAEAKKIWNSALPAPKNHWYLAKKQIESHHTRVDISGVLLVPIYENEEIVNLQRITTAKKLFLQNAKKRGCYSQIEGQQDVIYITEGFSTAASISEATGKLCVIAMDAGNLLPVARTIRAKFGVDPKIIIAGDNDQWLESNVGMEKAKQAAEAIYADVKFPDFPADDPEKFTDWNDFAARYGKDALRVALLPPHQEVVSDNSKIVVSKPVLPNLSEEFDVDDKGRPKCTIENLCRLVAKKRIILRYNVIKKQEEILIPDESYSLDNYQNASYARVLSFCKDEDMSTAQIGDYLTYLCDQNQYNPVTKWITYKEWDGVSRLGEFFDTIVADNKEIKELILTRWMVSAVASAFSPNGLATRGVLVFQGEQYLGKTSWFKRLVPKELDVMKDGYILRLDDKDNVFQCLSHWLVELGELEATFKKSDIAQLKAFIPMDRDIMRRPYARKDSCYARRTVFFASVNPKEFLFDETGNTRFWSIETKKINYDHSLDMQQVWAEFYSLYLAGEPYIMSSDEIKNINTANEEFMGADYHDELVCRRFNWDHTFRTWKTATEIAHMLGIQNPKQTDLNKLSKAVRKYNGSQFKRGGDGVRLLQIPEEVGGSMFDNRS